MTKSNERDPILAYPIPAYPRLRTTEIQLFQLGKTRQRPCQRFCSICLHLVAWKSDTATMILSPNKHTFQCKKKSYHRHYTHTHTSRSDKQHDSPVRASTFNRLRPPNSGASSCTPLEVISFPGVRQSMQSSNITNRLTSRYLSTIKLPR